MIPTQPANNKWKFTEKDTNVIEIKTNKIRTEHDILSLLEFGCRNNLIECSIVRTIRKMCWH